MAKTHTPGPWEANYGEFEIYAASGALVAVAAEVEGCEYEANLNLIAAAPELLAVVRMAIDYANDTKERFAVNFSSEDEDHYDKLMDAAEAAINKAEGRAGE